MTSTQKTTSNTPRSYESIARLNRGTSSLLNSTRVVDAMCVPLGPRPGPIFGPFTSIRERHRFEDRYVLIIDTLSLDPSA